MAGRHSAGGNTPDRQLAELRESAGLQDYQKMSPEERAEADAAGQKIAEKLEDYDPFGE